jgi:hypothetical protein
MKQILHAEIPGPVPAGGNGTAPAWIVRFNGGYSFTGNTPAGVVGTSTTRGHVATMNASVIRTITPRLDLSAV